MHQSYHVIKLHESTKKIVIPRVRIFTETKPNFMVTQCVLGKYLTKILPLSNTQQRKQPVSGSGVYNKQPDANRHVIGDTKNTDSTHNRELEA
jgi:hypothetical protein